MRSGGIRVTVTEMGDVRRGLGVWGRLKDTVLRGGGGMLRHPQRSGEVFIEV